MNSNISPSLAFLLLLLGCWVPTATVQLATDKQIEIISLGNVRPGGIHALPPEANAVLELPEGEDFVLVSDLLWGSVRALSTTTGNNYTIVDSQGFGLRAALGLWYDSGAIFAGKKHSTRLCCGR